MDENHIIAALDAVWWAIRNHYGDLMRLHGPENDKAPFLRASYAALRGGHYGENPQKNASIVLENIKGDRLAFPLIDAACVRLEAIIFALKIEEAFSPEKIKEWQAKRANDPRTPNDRVDEDWN